MGMRFRMLQQNRPSKYTKKGLEQGFSKSLTYLVQALAID